MIFVRRAPMDVPAKNAPGCFVVPVPRVAKRADTLWERGGCGVWQAG